MENDTIFAPVCATLRSHQVLGVAFCSPRDSLACRHKKPTTFGPFSRQTRLDQVGDFRRLLVIHFWFAPWFGLRSFVSLLFCYRYPH